MRVRQIDIARAAGVSRSTVAAVLSKKDHDPVYRIHADTEQMVLQVARQLNYSPSLIGRSLREQRTFLVGVLLNRVNFLYNGEIHTGIQEVLDHADYAPVVYAHTNDIENEWQCLESCLNRQVEGLIINAAITGDAVTNCQCLAELRRNHPLPTVEIFGRYVDGVPSVLFDYRKAARLAVQRLSAQGHTVIALFLHDDYELLGSGGQAVYHAAKSVHDGYQEAIQDGGLTPLVIHYPLSSDTTNREVMYRNVSAHVDRVLEHPENPTAVVVASSDVALSFLLRQRSSDRSRAERIVCAALGIANPILHSLHEAVCIDFPVEEVGRVATSILVDWIESGVLPQDPGPVYVPPRS